MGGLTATEWFESPFSCLKVIQGVDLKDRAEPHETETRSLRVRISDTQVINNTTDNDGFTVLHLAGNASL